MSSALWRSHAVAYGLKSLARAPRGCRGVCPLLTDPLSSRARHTYVKPYDSVDGALSVDVHKAREERLFSPLAVSVGFLQTFHTWRPVVRQLSRHRDVVVFETRGQGSSSLSTNPDDVSLSQIVDDIDAGLQVVLPQLGYDRHDKVDLCGFSFGALTTLGLAALHPHRVNKVVLTGLGAGELNNDRLNILRGWLDIAKSGSMEDLVTQVLHDTYGSAQNAWDTHKMKDSVARRNSLQNARVLLENVLLRRDVSVSRLARQLTAPVLFVSGENDLVGPARDIEALASVVPKACVEVEIIPKSGHVVFMENPEEWCSRVTQFLDNTGHRCRAGSAAAHGVSRLVPGGQGLEIGNGT